MRTRPNAPSIGIELGERSSRCCVLAPDGEVLVERITASTANGIVKALGGYEGVSVAVADGQHAGWVAALLGELHMFTAIVTAQDLERMKDPPPALSARALSELARRDLPERPPHEKQLARLRYARTIAVTARNKLAMEVFGQAKMAREDVGGISDYNVERVDLELLASVSPSLHDALAPVAEIAAALTAQIRKLDDKIAEIMRAY